jgi:rhamnosyl/mannosyltransferase
MGRPVILHVYKDYWPPVLGGIERTIHWMARETRSQVEPRVLVASGQWQGRREILDEVEVRFVGELSRVASTPLSIAFLRALRSELRRGVDLIHLHHPNPLGDLALLLSGTKLPVVMTYHSDVVRQKKLMLLYGPLQKWMMGRCARIMPTSPDYGDSSEWLQMFRERLRVVPLGIDVEALWEEPSSEERTLTAQVRSDLLGATGRLLVVFTGRLRYYKGVEYLLEAMALLPEEVCLGIGGDGPDGARLREIAGRLGLGTRVRFLGTLTDEEQRRLLRAADIYCMPSHLRSEAFGLSQVEAMAMGLPVVGTDLDTGVAFVNQHGKTGLIVKRASGEALAEGIRKLGEDEDLRRRLGELARQRVEKEFTAGVMGRRVLEVYREVLGDW